MAVSVQMKVVVNEQLTELYPKTSAANVIMSDGSTTVQSAITTLQTNLSALTTKVNTMYDKLFFESVYMTNSNGVTLTDGDGTNLVAVY